MSDLRVNARLTIPEREITLSAVRSSGPGGQNVNKVNSKVTLRWSPANCESLSGPWRDRFVTRFANRINREGELVLHSDKYRDQPRNMADVRQKLVEMLLECQAPPKSRKPTRPTLGSKRRKRDAKEKQSQKKQARRTDFRRDG
ncbi:alternative ribosome rescue aminoacyl-tRNA hydrolase ArfB [Stieleria varia]|uniref:Peptidyl-tRNA hydrolase ArfB n=1 Tax=Stieleria varia TaxID=2528005 RepID=A0A5C6AT82_9BACT|nr:alternative ribosome rescue aminoacyl-tRNA hydrolase ArfB [Stieleria varia]TWU02489.1 Peptidyl-tRNA hydrolase ArfB [Stieleria varia]